MWMPDGAKELLPEMIYLTYNASATRVATGNIFFSRI
jgi:hypothetical protein